MVVDMALAMADKILLNFLRRREITLSSFQSNTDWDRLVFSRLMK
jgi:hypothetical protein